MNNAIYLGMHWKGFHKQKVNEYEPYQINHYWLRNYKERP